MPNKRLPVLRWVAEFVLIVGSVYLAVFLEAASQQRQAHDTARVALTQLLGELEEDLQDFDRIIAHQDGLHHDYSNLRRWLSEPSSSPQDSIAAALFRVTSDNSTLFPRRASWTTMVNGGQLADLDAPDLVLRLGKLYETAYVRIDYNSADYDESLNDTFVAATGIKWHTLETRPLSDEPSELEDTASRLEWLRITWNAFYRDLLAEYRFDVLDAIAAVETFLGSDLEE
jgi:Family of unknown function (DUF6090)